MDQIKAQNNQNAQISTSLAAASSGAPVASATASPLLADSVAGFALQPASANTAEASAVAASVAPPEEAIRQLCERTGCDIVQENGQRRFGRRADWEGRRRLTGAAKCVVGKIPRDCFEDELVPVFETVGRATNEMSGINRGYGFCVYTNREDTKRAVRNLDNYEIRKGKLLGVCLSVDNCRLFVGGIPKNKTKQDILAEMRRVTDGVVNVIVYPSATNKEKNRGFCFPVGPADCGGLGGTGARVDEDIMAKNSVCPQPDAGHHRGPSARVVQQCRRVPDCVERVKKIRDYAFVHFKEREQRARGHGQSERSTAPEWRCRWPNRPRRASRDPPVGRPDSPTEAAASGGSSGVGGGVGIPRSISTAGLGMAGGGFGIIGAGGAGGGLQQLTLPAVPHNSGGAGGLPVAYNLIGGQPAAGLEPLTLAYCSQLLAAGHAGAAAALSP
uniref:RRM domain-containing protein n=1 Tax=Macrostomum lignano TaxID=282301 RepID=A0A1I8FBZ9_9PLAT